jgi:hypothetical protein
MSDNYDRDSDKAWARQMIDIWMREYSVPDGALDELADRFADAFQSARTQSRESIGDIQVKKELCGPNQWHFRVYVNGEQKSCVTHNRDIGILLGLGEKYLDYGDGRYFAKYIGRMLGIDDNWTE